MLPLDMGGVVDTTLRVYGTANVRVIDASVMPIHVTAHTMAPAYAIAEYGADIVKMTYWPIPAASSTTSGAGSGSTGGTSSGNGSNNESSSTSSGLTQNQKTIVIAATVAVGGAAALLVSILRTHIVLLTDGSRQGLLFWARRRGQNQSKGPEDPWKPSYADDRECMFRLACFCMYYSRTVIQIPCKMFLRATSTHPLLHSLEIKRTIVCLRPRWTLHSYTPPTPCRNNNP